MCWSSIFGVLCLACFKNLKFGVLRSTRKFLAHSPARDIGSASGKHSLLGSCNQEGTLSSYFIQTFQYLPFPTSSFFVSIFSSSPDDFCVASEVETKFSAFNLFNSLPSMPSSFICWGSSRHFSLQSNSPICFESSRHFCLQSNSPSELFEVEESNE